MKTLFNPKNKDHYAVAVHTDNIYCGIYQGMGDLQWYRDMGLLFKTADQAQAHINLQKHIYMGIDMYGIPEQGEPFFEIVFHHEKMRVIRRMNFRHSQHILQCYHGYIVPINYPLDKIEDRIILLLNERSSILNLITNEYTANGHSTD